MRRRPHQSTFTKGIDELLTAFLSPPASSVPTLRPGMPVVHEIFGEGTVLALEGEGIGARAQIKFAKRVVWYALSAGKVRPIEERGQQENPKI